MKVTAKLHGKITTHNGQDIIMLKATSVKDNDLIKKIFTAKAEREDRRGEESLLTCVLDLPYKVKSQKQLASVFLLVTAIFESMDDRKPTDEEKYELYDDLLNIYAYRRPSRLSTSETSAIRLSASNTFETSYFIGGLMMHLCTECQLTMDLQADVRSVLWDWERWKGEQELDPNDYYDAEKTRPLSEADFRKLHLCCQATGISENLVLHHIVTRGSNAKAIDAVWNWVVLSSEQHAECHAGEKAFLQKNDHLEGRFRRANKIADKLYSYGCIE